MCPGAHKGQDLGSLSARRDTATQSLKVLSVSWGRAKAMVADKVGSEVGIHRRDIVISPVSFQMLPKVSQATAERRRQVLVRLEKSNRLDLTVAFQA